MAKLFSLLVLLFALLTPGAGRAQEIVAAPAWNDGLDAIPAFPADWITEKGTWVRVHGHPDEFPALLRVARHASEALPRLADALDVPIGNTVQIVVASTDASFRELQPGRAPSWADAVAYPSLGVVYLRAPSARGGQAAPLEQVLDHELVHVLLGRAFAPDLPPSWLQEGVAQVLAGEMGPDVARTLATGEATGGLVALDSLERGFPRDPLRARLAYAQTADFVAWLTDTHGADAIPRLVRHTREGHGLAAAVRHVTGEGLDEVEATWRARWAAASPVRWSALLDESLLLGLGGILLAFGGVSRKRAFRRRMEELAREEAELDALLASWAARRTA